MKGKSSQEMVSDRMRRISLGEGGATVSLSRKEASVKAGRMNSSEMIVSKKIHPNVAAILLRRFCQSIFSVRGYSIS